MLRYSIYEEFTLFVLNFECFYAKIQNSQQTFFEVWLILHIYSATLKSYFEVILKLIGFCEKK